MELQSSNESIESLKEKIKKKFKSYRGSHKGRHYPKYLRRLCQQAIKVGVNDKEVALLAGVSIQSIRKWSSEGTLIPKAEDQGLKVLNVVDAASIIVEPKIVFNVSGIRIEVFGEVRT